MIHRYLFGCCVAAIGFCSAAHSSAAIVYQDAFARTGDLNGSSPAPIDATGATWTAPAGKFTVNTGSVSVAAAGANSGFNAFLPLNVSAAGVYTLTTTVAPAANAGNSDWLAVGFTSSVGTTGFFQNTPPNPQLWVLYRANGGTQSFFGGGTNNGADGGTAATPGAPDTFTLTLNSTSGAFSITDTLGLINRTGALSAASVAAINDVAIGQFVSEPGSFSNFQVATTAPEPASLGLLALGAVPLLARRRRA